jgi:anti-sigma factor RsiW
MTGPDDIEAPADAGAHAEIEERFSDYLDGAASPAEREQVDRHLAGCERCRAAYATFQETVRAVSGLHRMSAPQHFDREVAHTIHRRSAGRFFGRRAFGDRVPFELLAVIALGLALAVYALVKMSDTGSARPDREVAPPSRLDPAVKEVIPRP